MLPSIPAKEKLRIRAPPVGEQQAEVAQRLFMRSRQSHRTLRQLDVEHPKQAFYADYRNIRRLSERHRFQSLNSPSNFALLSSLEKHRLQPRSLGLISPSGSQAQLTLTAALAERYVGAFSKGLKQLKSLEKINIRGNKLSHKSSLRVLKNVNSSHVRDLDLSSNCISQEGVTQLLRFLHQETLRSLSLEASQLTEVSAAALSRALEQNSSLQHLNLSKNSLANKAGIALGRMLELNSTVKDLDLHWNLLYQEGAEALFHGLRINTGLLQLDLSWNGIGTTPNYLVHSLATFLKENTTLKHLDLSYNSLSAADCKILAEALEGNHTLVGLHMLGNACVVDSLGYVEVPKYAKCMKHPYANRRLLRESRPGENCWVCDKWIQVRIEYPNSTNCLFFVHIEIDGFKPILMKNKGDSYVYMRALPPRPTHIFFSTLDGLQPLLTTLNQVDSGFEGELAYCESHKVTVSVETMNVLVPEGPSFAAMDSLKVKPRCPLPVYIPGIEEAIKPPWDFNKSIFRDYILDTPAYLVRCFEFDWKHAKVERFVKDESELITCRNILKNSYQQIKDLYKVLSLFSFGEYFSVSSNTFFDMLSQGEVFDTSYGASDFGVNWNSTILPKIKGQLYNPGNALVRYEFMELIVRIACDKYLRGKVTPNGPTNASEALLLFLEELHPVLNSANFNNFKTKYFCEEVENFFLSHMELIERVFTRHSGRKTLPGKKAFMSLEEFRELSAEVAGVTEFSTAREVDQAYCFAMMTQIDELFQKRHMEMNRLEFFEALARLSDSIVKSNVEALHDKLEHLVPRLELLANVRSSMKRATT